MVREGERAEKSYWRGRLSTVDLLVLTSLEKLHFKLKIVFTLFTKQATLIRRPTVPSLPFQQVFPGKSEMKWKQKIFTFTMDKLYLTGWALGRVFNFRSGFMHTMHLLPSVAIWPNLELKTRPKQLLGSFPIVIALPAFIHFNNLSLQTFKFSLSIFSQNC